MNHYNKDDGFTIVELTLAMAFISALLLAIAMTVVQISNIYNKGVTVKTTNQAVTYIAKQLKDTISSTTTFDLNTNYIKQNWGGRLCTGAYTFVWNYGSSLNNNIASKLNSYSDSKNKIRFIKVIDNDGKYCINPGLKISSNNALELLNVSQDDILALHGFNITSLKDGSTGQTLYNIAITVGTNNANTLSGVGNDTVCKAPSILGADSIYCSVTELNITARAGAYKG